MSRPLFLSLDGLDGGGKSTQCRLLAEWLRQQGREVVACVDPGGTALGGELREILLSHKGHMAPACEALLFMASRAQLVDEVIRPALAAGKVVLSDRYLLATVVYQGHAGALDVDFLWQVGRLATGGLEPDATFVLDVPLETSLGRRRRPADRMESRPLEDQERVRQGFLAEARRRPEYIHVIDARAGVDEVQAVLRHEVKRLLVAADHDGVREG
jgi:dTMP kinase